MSTKLQFLIEMMKDSEITKEHLNISQEYLDHNELGIALDQIIYALLEDNIMITEDQYNVIETLAKDLNMATTEYSCLRELIIQNS